MKMTQAQLEAEIVAHKARKIKPADEIKDLRKQVDDLTKRIKKLENL